MALWHFSISLHFEFILIYQYNNFKDIGPKNTHDKTYTNTQLKYTNTNGIICM